MKFYIFCVFTIFSFSLNFGDALNERPIIGILTQEITSHLNSSYPGHKQFIAASYVKFVEGGGGRVVPVWINETQTYYRDIMSKINGILFPGGSSGFKAKYGYAEAGYKIYKIAKEMNDAGSYFPIWGTCLGFELLTFVDADKAEHRERCSSQDQPLPLEFVSEFKNHRLFSLASDDVIESLRTKEITSNFHNYCTVEEKLKEVNIDSNWIALSHNSDWDGFRFISTIENTKYPFYGTQFHPEKNMYEWPTTKVITHDEDATRANQYFARFFVEEARKSSNGFGSVSEERRHLIWNFPKTFSGAKGSVYSEVYLFKPEDDYPSKASVVSKSARSRPGLIEIETDLNEDGL
uniref:folate gamma-glutamyl hydrolase n=1 Tax=Culicoides sonorensis TaxID=179676 RepID=A0A336MKR8_CULSO